MKKTLLLTFLFTLIATLGFSQTDKFWSASTESRATIITDKAVARSAFPKEFKLFSLNIEPLRKELFSIVGNHPLKHSTVISLPNADGGIEQFEVFEASNFEPALQARFPEIRAYSGKGITDKSATLKLSISPQGIQTMLFRTEKENEFIEAYSKDHNVYAVFSVIATPKPTLILTASPFTKLMPGLSTSITATASSATTTNFIYTWSYTGAGPTQTFVGNTHLVNLSGLGTYTVTAADASNLSCVSQSQSITIGDSASTKLFVFPSPNDGRFTISYYTAGASATNKTKQSIVIYDSYGRKVYEENKDNNVTQAYQLFSIDMRRNGSGIYFIVLREANGNKIKTGKVVVR